MNKVYEISVAVSKRGIAHSLFDLKEYEKGRMLEKLKAAGITDAEYQFRYHEDDKGRLVVMRYTAILKEGVDASA